MSTELQRLRVDHGPAILAFEVANRAYFAASISDRGDDYFERFNDGLDQLLAEQETGCHAYFVLVQADGTVTGRFNLFNINDGVAELGYRVAQRVAGRGVATAAVREVCRMARTQLGLHTLTARTTLGNVASQRVLAKAGFVPAGSADIAGRPAICFRLDLASSPC